MEDAREMADAQGVSINQFLATLIAERIGESIVEATVGRWLKQVGDTVAAGEAPERTHQVPLEPPMILRGSLSLGAVGPFDEKYETPVECGFVEVDPTVRARSALPKISRSAFESGSTERRTSSVTSAW